MRRDGSPYTIKEGNEERPLLALEQCGTPKALISRITSRSLNMSDTNTRRVLPARLHKTRSPYQLIVFLILLRLVFVAQDFVGAFAELRRLSMNRRRKGEKSKQAMASRPSEGDSEDDVDDRSAASVPVFNTKCENKEGG